MIFYRWKTILNVYRAGFPSRLVMIKLHWLYSLNVFTWTQVRHKPSPTEWAGSPSGPWNQSEAHSLTMKKKHLGVDLKISSFALIPWVPSSSYSEVTPATRLATGTSIWYYSWTNKACEPECLNDCVYRKITAIKDDETLKAPQILNRVVCE